MLFLDVLSPLLQSSEYTEDISALQKSADFVKAFILGFEVQVRREEEARGCWKEGRG